MTWPDLCGAGAAMSCAAMPPALGSKSTERGTTRTGQGERRTTSSETPPSRTRHGPVSARAQHEQVEVLAGLVFEHADRIADEQSRLGVEVLGDARGGAPERQLAPHAELAGEPLDWSGTIGGATTG